MKLLIFKLDGFIDEGQRKNIYDALHRGIEDGVVFVDGAMKYEVVEFDSIRFDLNKQQVSKKSRRDLLKRNMDLIKERGVNNDQN